MRILCIFLSLNVAVESAKVTPMEKVIGLLKDLSAKVAAEGKKEAAQYDKYACFCKEQADEKLYSIEKSDAKIADLKAEIEELSTAIAQLGKEIGDLSGKITKLENEIDEKTKKRAGQRAIYEAKAKDMNEAIAACGAAIDALKESKGSLSDAKVDLVQLNAKVAKVAKGAPKFEYQSNDIIATLEGLLAQFKDMKKNLDFEEHDTKSAFEKNKLGLSNEKKFAEKERAEKEAISESKTEANEAAKSDRDAEQADRDADDSFMQELTNECEAKANQFDQRSKMRADELSTLADATKKLQEGAVPNFASNKKLVGLQKSAAPKSATKPLSFVQINSVQHQESNKEAVLQRVRAFLNNAAEHTASRTLLALAGRVSVAEDHFVKVRGLIKDLIQRLKDDAKAEATQKGVCDVGMAKAIASRDEANAKIEAANAAITTQTATKNELNDEIAKLQVDISELKKGLKEATELRNEDKAENEKTMEMSEEGAEAVKSALELLKGFYENAFVQVKYTPPNADKDGNTVGDLAPEVFDSTYHGAQAESKGIVGILEVILSDFERTNSQTKKNEGSDQEEFEKFEKDTNDDVDKKEGRIEKAEGEVADAEAAILENEGALADANTLLEDSLAKLDDLKKMCVDGEETWEERKQKREDEIEALKSALAIFEDWKGL